MLHKKLLTTATKPRKTALAATLLTVLYAGAALAQATSPFGGAGTEESPYTIDSLGALIAFADSVNEKNSDYGSKHYKLTTDIDLSSKYGASIGEGEEATKVSWTPIGSGSSNAFSGVFNGNGKIISGLYIDTSSLAYVGLFGYVSGPNARVLGVGVSGSITVRAPNNSQIYTGGLVGFLSQGTVDSCFVKAKVSVSNTSNQGSSAGGVAGYVQQGGSVLNCYATDSVSATNTSYPNITYAGGVVGHLFAGQVKYVYSTGTVTTVGYAGGVVGYNSTQSNTVASSAALNQYVTGGVISGSDTLGGAGRILGGYATGGYPNVSDNVAFYDIKPGTDGLPFTGSNSANGQDGLDRVRSDLQKKSGFPAPLTATPWIYTEATDTAQAKLPKLIAGEDLAIPAYITNRPTSEVLFGGGQGTDVDPFIIRDTTELRLLRNMVNEPDQTRRKLYYDKHYKLDTDINLAPYQAGEGWVPIGGTRLASGGEGEGGVSVFKGGFDGNNKTISGLTIAAAATHGGFGLFGYILGGTVKNLTVSGASVTIIGNISGNYVGAVAGRVENNAVIENCKVINTTVSGRGNYIGGVAGRVVGNVTSCVVTGGSVGSSSNSNVGGVVGYLSGDSVAKCAANNVTVVGSQYVGGVAGQIYSGRLANSSATGGTVTGSSQYVGGVAGYVAGRVDTCFATNAVTGATNTGGVAGYVGWGITNSYHTTGAVTGGQYTGGVAGQVYNGSVDTCYASGAVSGTSYVGGVVGHVQSGNVTASKYTSGTVTATGNESFVGGVVGSVYSGKVDSCFSAGAVEGAYSYVGGVAGSVGYSNGNGGGGVVKSYSTGTVTGTANSTYTGGVVGYIVATSGSNGVFQCYATGAVTGGQYTGGLVGYFTGSYAGAGVNQCYATGAVTGLSESVGGVAGYFANSADSVANSYATGAVSGTNNVGGVVGYLASGGVKTSYATGRVTATNTSSSSYAGGIVGYVSSTASITNNAALNPIVKGSGTVGRVYGTYGSYAPTLEGNIAFIGIGTDYGPAPFSWADSGSGKDGLSKTHTELKHETNPAFPTAFASPTWSYTNGRLPILNFAKGDTAMPAHIKFIYADVDITGAGTSASPYAISTAKQLEKVAQVVNEGNRAYNNDTINYKITATNGFSLSSYGSTDTDYNGGKGWYPIGRYYASFPNTAFLAKFDGDSKPISGLYISDGNRSPAGLFGRVDSNGTVTKVVVSSPSISANSYVGGVVGYFNNKDANLENCYVNGAGSVTGTSGSPANVGGLVGYFAGADIKSCSTTVAVTGDYNNVGGVVGNFAGSGGITGAKSYGNVTISYSSYSNAGGIAGLFSKSTAGAINNCHALGKVLGNPGSYIGGVVGYFNITATSGDKGGIISSSSADTVRGGLYTGGIAGAFVGDSIFSSTANGAVSGSSYTGGVVGQFSGKFIRNSSAVGPSVSGGLYTGGVVGYFSGDSVAGSHSTAAVSGGSYVGGVTGTNNTGNVRNCYSTGAVSGTGERVGGVAGMLNVKYTITRSYSTGAVTGGYHVGGVAGFANGRVYDSYSLGAVTGTSNNDANSNFYESGVGGVAGTVQMIANAGDETEGLVAGSYASGAVSGYYHVGGVVGYVYAGCAVNASAALNPSVTGVTAGRVVGYEQAGKTFLSGNFAFDAIGTDGGAEFSDADSANGKDGLSKTAAALQKADGFPDTLTKSPPWTYEPGKLPGHGAAVDMPKHITDALTAVDLFADGSGKSSDPYIIETAAQLLSLATEVNKGNLALRDKSYQLKNDISLAAYGASYNSGYGWVPIGVNADNSFRGTFDGNGKTITGLYINNDTLDNAGLFGYLRGGKVKKLTVSGAAVTGLTNVGAVAGTAAAHGAAVGRVDSCKVTGGTVTGGTYVGGVAGLVQGTVANSYSTSTVSGTSYIGGVAGYVAAGGGVANSYSTGAVSGSSNYVGGIVGVNNGSVASSWSTSAVSGYSNVGGIAGSGGNITNSAALNITVKSTSTNVGRVTGYSSSGLSGNVAFIGVSTGGGAMFSGTDALTGQDGSSKTAAELKIKDSLPAALTVSPWTYKADSLPGLAGAPLPMPAHIVDAFIAGNGTETSPFEIGTAALLAKLAELVNEGLGYRNRHYKITADINLAEYGESYNSGAGWTPIGNGNSTFTGTLDGQNKTITGLYINANLNRAGLFGAVYGGTVKNLVIEGGSVRSNSYNAYVGGVVGYLNGGSVVNCRTSTTVSGSGSESYVGGVVGNTTGSVDSCSATGTVTGGTYTGGVVGYLSSGSVVKSFSTGAVTGTTYVGGVVGYVNNNTADKVENCYAMGAVTSTVTNSNYYIGGVAGYVYFGSITSCYATGAVSGSTGTSYTTYAGGIVGGWNSITINNVAALNPSVTGGYYAGRTGYNLSITNSTAFSYMTLTAYNRSTNGTSKDFAALQTSDGFPAALSAAPWTYEAGKLPGFGAAVTMPEHLTEPFPDGDGTADDPWQISRASQLARLAAYVNANTASGAYSGSDKYYKLTANIDLSGYGTSAASFNGGRGWVPIGTQSYPFTGNFDGNGKTISGLEINDANLTYAGLFGYVSGGTIEKLGIEGGSVVGGSNVGGVVGYLTNSGVVKNCYAGVAVSGGYAGGIAGNIYTGSTVTACYSTGAVIGGTYAGGVVGVAEGSSTEAKNVVTNNAALNITVTATYAGRVVGYVSTDYTTSSDNIAFSGMATNSSGSTEANDGTSRTAANLKTADAFPSQLKASPWTYKADSLPGLAGAPLPMPAHIGAAFAGGSGTTSSPYQIASAAQLAMLAAHVNAGTNNSQYNNKHYRITADSIDLSGYNWMPIGRNSTYSFSGVFDGNGKKIKGLNLNNASLQYAGLFGYVSGGTVKGVRIEGGSVTGSYSSSSSNYVGGVVGYLNGGSVENSYVTASVTGSNTYTSNYYLYIGGIAGYVASSGSVVNCYTSGAVTGSAYGYVYAGGLVGDLYSGSVEGSWSAGAVSGTTTNYYAYAGGLVGYSYSSGNSITNSAALNISLTGSNSAGRVYGAYSSSFTLSNNVAFIGIAGTFSGSNTLGGQGGESRTYEQLRSASGFPEALTESPWTYKADSLPGLGAAIAMPDHIKNWKDKFTGSGTEAKPYEISTVEDLEQLRTLVNNGDADYNGKYYQLTATIDLSGKYGSGTDKSSWTPIGTNSSPFYGVLDGNKKRITGLYINLSGYYHVGLFGYVTGTIKNLGVEGSSVTGSYSSSSSMYVGGVVGYLYGGTVENSYVTASVTGTHSNSSYSLYVGGVVGYITNSGSVKSCYSIGAVSGSAYYYAYVGGLVGYVESSGGSITHSAALNPSVTGSSTYSASYLYAGRVLGGYNSSYPPTLSGNVAFMGMDEEYFSGEFRHNGKDGLDADFDMLSTADGFPVPLTAAPWTYEEGSLPGLDGVVAIPAHIRGYTAPEREFDGYGTEANPYQITSLEDLEKLAGLVNEGNRRYSGSYYILTDDIDMSETYSADGESWTPIGTGSSYPFSGVFDGGSKKISKLYVDLSDSLYVGLFGYVSDGTVKNLAIAGGSVTGSYDSYENLYVGGVVGYLNGGSVENSYVTASVTGSHTYSSTSHSSYVGGVAGYVANSGLVKNCYTTGAVTAGAYYYPYAGGVVGYHYSGGVESSWSTSAVTASSTAGNYNAYAGGLVGYSGTSVTNSIKNSAALNISVTGYSSSIGRVTGYYTSSYTTLSGNIAFMGMTAGDNNFSGGYAHNGKDGADMTAAGLKSGTGFPAAFKADPWTHNTDSLPGLFGKPVPLPEYINTSTAGFAFKGLGVETDPFQISTLNDLDSLASFVNNGNVRYSSKYYIMTNDIDLSEKYGRGKIDVSWTPIGYSSSYPFTGVFDGDSNKITGLYVSTSGHAYVGLFGYISGGGVRNLGIEGGSVSGSYSSSNSIYVGGLVGYLTGGTVENSYVTASVTGNHTYSSSYSPYVGGIAGYVTGGGSVVNCYTTSAVTATAYYYPYAGGLVGHLYTGSVESSWSASAVSAGSTGGYYTYAGGLVGSSYTSGNSIANSAALNLTVSGTQSGHVLGDYNNSPTQTGNVIYNGIIGLTAYTGTGSRSAADLKESSGFPTALTAAPWTYVADSLPGLFGKPVPIPEHISDEELFGEEDGDGTEDDPFQITKPFQLYRIAMLINNGTDTYRYNSANYVLMNDISLSAYNWMPMGSSSYYFSGVFDGNGKRITGLNVSSSNTYVGLFGYVYGGTIKNLGVEGVTVSGSQYVGGIAGILASGGKIENCYATVAVTATGSSSYAGGIVGYLDGHVTAVYSTGAVSGYSSSSGAYAGGLVGYTEIWTGGITNSAALNPRVTGYYSSSSYSNIGRVTGYTSSYTTLSGNIAFMGMMDTSYFKSGNTHDGKNGADVPGGALQTSDAFPTALTASPWTYQAAALPGLGGKTVAMPDYIKNHDFMFAFKGAGTASYPFEIATLEDLETLATLVNGSGGNTMYGNKYYKLMNDISLYAGDELRPIGTSSSYPFSGVFDGGKNKIRDLNVYSSSSNVGLFGYVSGGTVKNLGIERGSVTGNAYVGAIVGYLTGDGKVENCYSTVAVSASSQYVGGIVGYLDYGSVTAVYSTGAVSTSGSYSSPYAGGIVGYAGSSGYSNSITNSVALNPRVTGYSSSSSSAIGRVVGYYSSSYTTLSDNFAFRNMMDTSSFTSEKTRSGKNGADVTAGSLSDSIPAALKTDPWAYADGSLPGLGAVAGLPRHMVPSAEIHRRASGGSESALTGNPRVGYVLAAKPLNRSSAASTLTYKWKLDGSDLGVTVDSLRVTENHVGGRIMLEMFEGDSKMTTDTTRVVLKGEAASSYVPQPSVEYKTHNSVKLVMDTTIYDYGYASYAYYYDEDGNLINSVPGPITWQKSSLFNGLTPSTEYSFYRRIAETKGASASSASSRIYVTTNAAPNDAAPPQVAQAPAGAETPEAAPDSAAAPTVEAAVPSGGPTYTAALSTASAAPSVRVSTGFTAGPNPVSRSSGSVNFFLTGRQVADGELRVYDGNGNVVGKVKIADGGAAGYARRQVGSWDLRDARGRAVPSGTYLVRGVLRASSGGGSEKVSLILGVR